MSTALVLMTVDALKGQQFPKIGMVLQVEARHIFSSFLGFFLLDFHLAKATITTGNMR